MKEIPLTQGYKALVDDEDYEFLNQRKWQAVVKPHTVYARRHFVVDGKERTEWMHRVILGITDPDIHADHRDLDGLNNQRENLRACTKADNNRNQGPRKGCTSEYKGVGWLKRDRKWWSKIRIGDNVINLGKYTNEIDAAMAYNEKAKELFGEFAWLNKI